MDNYYEKSLHASNLFKVYETQIPRVREYLDAEVDFVRKQLNGNEAILELGAGYGRIIKQLAPFAASLTGVDISADSVIFGKEYLKECKNCNILQMDVHNLAIDNTFDIVLCLQNGISAFKGEPEDTLLQALKVLKNGGKAYFSTYSPKFWDTRVAWFKEQADKGLLGELDMEKTKDGNIVCVDGFTATTYTIDQLEALGRRSGYQFWIAEVNESSVFLIVEKK